MSIRVVGKLFKPLVVNARVQLTGNSLPRFCARSFCTAGEKVNEPIVPAEEAKKESDDVDKEALLKQVEELKDEINVIRDKLLRQYAEEENIRRIAKKDVEDARAYANTSFAKSLLDVADNLQRAVACVNAENSVKDHAEGTLKSLLSGVTMTRAELFKVFDKFGVKEFGSVGEKFNPNLHEALFRVPTSTPEQVEGTVAQVVKSGFMLKDRVIRPAEVGAYVKPN